MSNKLKSVSAKLTSKLPTSANTRDKEEKKLLCSGAIAGLKTILQMVKGVAGHTGYPGLQAGISALISILDVIQKMSRNAHDIAQLAEKIDGLNIVLENSKKGGQLSLETLGRIDQLSSTWIKVDEELKTMMTRNAFKRAIHYNDDENVISGHIQTITWSIQSFTVETLLAMEFALDEHIHFMKDAANRIEGKIDKQGETLQLLTAKLDGKDGHPPHALLAPFDCRDREPCLAGTRSEILARIAHWINLGHLGFSDTKEQKDVSASLKNTKTTMVDRRIFWINGSAGTGKTTIAYTVAAACRRHHVLGASFFCSRDDAECSNPKMIVPTIAYQLGLFFPPFQVEVARALKAQPDIGYSSVPYQLEELIVKPLRAVRKSFPRCLVVFDAVDECKDHGSTSIILSSLARHVTELSPLKFLLTSRPEPKVNVVFGSTRLGAATQRFILRPVKLDVVHNDIMQFLTSNLYRIRKSYYGIQDSWPPLEDIRSLAQQSCGLFIFAATSIKFIEDRKYSDPLDQLVRLLNNASTLYKDSSSPHRHLDQLYTQVLNDAFPEIADRLLRRLKMVLGTIVLLQDPLPLRALKELLKFNGVRNILAHLHSILLIPDNDDEVIRLLHPSFFDFMISPDRCLDRKFLVTAEMQHALLARACLETMKGLKRDICQIRDPSLLNIEIPDLRTRIMTCIPSHVQYACRHWASHLGKAMMSDALLDLVKEFCSNQLLYWIEICSLLGELRNVLFAVDDAQRKLGDLGATMTQEMNLLRDCGRFVLEFFTILSTSALQVYHSALLFTPKETSLYMLYNDRRLVPTMNLCSSSSVEWSPCMRVMEGHTQTIQSVACSTDGTRIVSGSDDRTLRIWDAVSGAHLNTLKGHSNSVYSVAFSTDGTRIVSGSGDRTLRIWDAVSGAHLNTLKGHSNSVYSVAFSTDGTRIASGSWDNTLRIWDAVSGAHLNTLKGHSNSVASVAFSTDGTRIVSGSWDNTLRLWDAVSGLLLETIQSRRASLLLFLNVPDLLSQFSTYRPGTSTSTDQLPVFTMDRDTGWICSVYPKRRLCWLPVSFQQECYSSSSNRFAIGTRHGQIVIIDLTGIQSYLEHIRSL